MEAAVAEARFTKVIGTTDAARKFVRRFIYTGDSDNETTGMYDETIRLDTWKPREGQSHIKRVCERVQAVMPSDNGVHMFTYLEVEYKCGCREEMFRWRGVQNFDFGEGYDRERGLMRL